MTELSQIKINTVMRRGRGRPRSRRNVHLNKSISSSSSDSSLDIPEILMLNKTLPDIEDEISENTITAARDGCIGPDCGVHMPRDIILDDVTDFMETSKDGEALIRKLLKKTKLFKNSFEERLKPLKKKSKKQSSGIKKKLVNKSKRGRPKKCVRCESVEVSCPDDTVFDADQVRPISRPRRLLDTGHLAAGGEQVRVTRLSVAPDKSTLPYDLHSLTWNKTHSKNKQVVKQIFLCREIIFYV